MRIEERNSLVALYVVVTVIFIVVFSTALYANAQTKNVCTPEFPCGITWNANTEPDMSHYNLYYGSRAGKWDGANSPYRINHPNTNVKNVASNLNLGDGNYVLALTAVDLAGNESTKSNKLSLTVDSGPPATPTITITVTIP